MAGPATISELGRRFSIPGVAEIVAGESGLPKVRINTPRCSGEVYLHGAHVTSWQPAGRQPVLFLSSASLYSEGKAIRGGVPVCFPWFADKSDDAKAPPHGLVRTRSWSLDTVTRDGDVVTLSLSFEHTDAGEAFWPQPFRLEHRITFGSELRMDLVATNVDGSSQRFEEAQHAYYSVGDVRQSKIIGLDDTRYIDKTDKFREKLQAGELVLSGETDRVYLNTERDIVIDDPVLKRKIIVRKRNSRTTVVWNPWREKAKHLADLDADKWARFLCVETSNVGPCTVELAPGESHTMTTLEGVES